MIILITIGLLLLLAAVGFCTTVFFCKERNGTAVIGYTAILGPAVFLMLSNIIGYIVPIQQSFVISTVILALWCGYIFLSQNDKQRGIQEIIWPPRRLLILLSSIAALAGLAYARFPGSDYWTYTHYPLTSTIVAGNFPVFEVGNPWHKINYHYGTQLLAAGIISLTSIQLTTTHAFMPPIAAISILFLATSLAWSISKKWKSAVLAGILAFCGTGFYWLNGIYLIQDLFNHFIIGETNASPFKWLVPTIRNMYAQAPIMMLGHRAISIGISFLFASLYALKQSWETKSKIRLAWSTISIICASATALTLETSFVLLVPAILAFTLTIIVAKHMHWIHSPSKVLLRSSIIILITVLIAKFQGGPLTSLDNQVGASSFSLGIDGKFHIDGGPKEVTIAIWEWLFFRDYVPHILLATLSTLFFWKRREKYSLFVFLLCILALGHILVPFLFIYEPFEANLNRLTFVFFSLVGIFGGIYIWETWVDSPIRIRKIIGILFTTGMLIAAPINVATYILFPSLEFQKSPLFPQMPTINNAQEELYTWIRKNTTQADWFFLYETHADTVALDARIIFPIYTGRFPVGNGETYTLTAQERILLDRLNEECSQDAFTKLGIRYLVLPTISHKEWFQKYCSAEEWEIVYHTKNIADGIPLQLLQVKQ